MAAPRSDGFQIRRDIVQLGAETTLAQLLDASSQSKSSDEEQRYVVVPIAADRFIVLLSSIMLKLADRLSSALNQHSARKVLDTSVGELFHSLAGMGVEDSMVAQQNFDAWLTEHPDGVGALLKDGRAVGVLIFRAVAITVESLLERIGVNPQRLQDRGAKVGAPTKEMDMAEAINEGDVDSFVGHPAPMTLPSWADKTSGDGAGESGDVDSLSAGSEMTESVDESAKSFEPPAPGTMPGLTKESIRLDVATPDTAVVNEAFDIAVAIRQLTSPPLRVDDLVRLSSTEGAIFRAPNIEIVRYRVEVEAKDCDVEPPSYAFLLEKGKDSLIQYFQLTPRREGNISIVVNAYQADDATLAASTRVRLKAVVKVVAANTIVSPMSTANATTPLSSASSDVIGKLYDALRSDKFSLDDLMDIAFRLGVRWDELSGDTQSGKARALVQHLQERNGLTKLRDLIKAERPELEV